MREKSVNERKDQHMTAQTGGETGPGAEVGLGTEAAGGFAAPPADDLAPAEETAVEPTPDPVAALETELAQARAEVQEFRDSWYRTAADLENFRRRSARDLAEGQERARAEVLLAMVQVLDDVERALAASGAGDEEAAGGEGDPIAAGLRLIRGRITDALRRHGVAEIPACGAAFDPHVHEAVMQAPADTVPAGHVAQVLERGYCIGERVLRPARVVVAMERS